MGEEKPKLIKSLFGYGGEKTRRKGYCRLERVRETQSFSFSSFIAEEKMICKSDDIFNGFRGFSCREKEKKLYLRRRSVFSPFSFYQIQSWKFPGIIKWRKHKKWTAERLQSGGKDINSLSNRLFFLFPFSLRVRVQINAAPTLFQLVKKKTDIALSIKITSAGASTRLSNL